MRHLRPALATRCLKLPLQPALRAVARGGAKGVQFDLRDEVRATELSETGIRQLLHHIDELGLRVVSSIFPTRHSLYEEEQLDGRVAALRAAMKFARQLRSQVLVVRAGRIPTDQTAKDYQVMREVLSDLAHHANQVGVSLALTPSQDAPDVLGEFVESISTGPIGVDFDPAAFLMSGHKPTEAFRRLHQLILHFSARDAIRDIDGSGMEVPIGRGEVDWLELLALLEESGYSGWTTILRTRGDDQPGDVLRGVQYLMNVGMG